MKFSRLRLAALLAVLIATLGIAACGDDSSDDSGSSGDSGSADLGLNTEGELLVGTDAPFPPFEIGTPDSGDFSGYDIEVMNAIAEKLGVEPTYQNTSFNTIFRDTAAGQFDIAAAASTITPEREQTVAFSDPYYEAQQALVVPVDSDIASVDDLSGAIVGVQDGTTGETYASDETDAGEVRPFPQGPDAIAALANGQVDAVIIDQPVAVDAEEQNSDVTLVEEIQTDELYGFAMAPDNTALIEAVNGALDDLKSDGTIDDLYEKYFSTQPPESVTGG
ncbi:basic amino acid ABC transporter substrate-binding protein [Thermoleophilia bacterium SCSIO 60948]|nr:basic amino acid ABC transporter substrate-binding protein [Thermoleophilia bacterium SCSIO 60948]